MLQLLNSSPLEMLNGNIFMNRIKTLIIDDEWLIRSELKTMLVQYPNIDVIGEAANVNEAVKLCTDLKPDLVFLDIVFPGSDGFSLLKQVQYRDFEVIFTTAYDEYALQAVKNSALDYLLKPINIDELEESLEKVKMRLQTSGNENTLDEKLKSLINDYEHFHRDEQKLGIPTQSGIRFKKPERNE